jgi:molybdopterin-guanine dinucleotide biosynthesis protein MobB
MIAFVGTSGSGKTATMEYLTSQLTRLGFRVGVAKHIHEEGFTIDTEGKDTWRHAHAGARIVIGASPNELAVIKKTSSEAKFKEIVGALSNQELDIALLEGFSTASDGIAKLPKVVTAKDVRGLKYTLRGIKPPILAVTGRITRSRKEIRNAPAPLVDIRSEGFLLTSMIRRLLRPNEMKEMLTKAAKKHGATCMGLAIGTRAAFLASNVLGEDGFVPVKITCGTKHCIAEAFHTLYPKAAIHVEKVRNDRVVIKSRGAELVLQLAPKEKANFTGITEVLSVPDMALFDSVTFTQDGQLRSPTFQQHST